MTNSRWQNLVSFLYSLNHLYYLTVWRDFWILKYNCPEIVSQHLQKIYELTLRRRLGFFWKFVKTYVNGEDNRNIPILSRNILEIILAQSKRFKCFIVCKKNIYELIYSKNIFCGLKPTFTTQAKPKLDPAALSVYVHNNPLILYS